MIEKRQKRDSKEDKIFKVLFSILTLALIGFLLISNLKINQKRSKLTAESESLKKEIQILEEKKTKLEAGISATEKESYWEEKIRQQGFVREGENPVVVLQPEEIQEEKTTENQKLSEKFFEKIKDFFARVIPW
jgi:cell division protein FtsB